MRTGLDYAHYRPTMPSLKVNGISFVVRYLLPDSMSVGNPPKGLSFAEATTLSDAGLDIVCNYEFDPRGMAKGAAQGTIDAKIVLGELARCKVPKTVPPRPVYFSADDDFTPAMIPPMIEYEKAAEAILKPAGYAVGVYGGLRAVKASFDAGFDWGWQTFAWSGTPTTIWDPRAQIRQVINNNLFNGQTDTDIAMVDDFGQWDLDKVVTTIGGTWETPIDIPGVGTFPPGLLLGEIYARSGERGAITTMAADVNAIQAQLGEMALDIKAIKDVLSIPPQIKEGT